MVAPRAVFRPEMTVGDAIEPLRPLVRTAFVTYGYVAGEAGKLARPRHDARPALQ